ncbi:MAG TPA: hypothetical protein VLX28_22445 [Thermoanaerobaculia bacterium]|nr:hypothetical protein [Thermoanaerobaculia bacterium]
MDLNSYKVLPEEVELSVPRIGGGTVLALLFTGYIIFMLLFALSTNVSSSLLQGSVDASLILILFAFAFIAAAGLSTLIVSRSRRSEREKEYHSRQQGIEAEARYSTQVANELIRGAVAESTDLPQWLEKTKGYLKKAEAEYHATAFGLFWDNIEDAVRSLASFRRQASAISRKCDEYRKNLGGKKHNYPPLSFFLPPLLDPASTLAEFDRMFRIGQQDHRFAMLWEHRSHLEVRGLEYDNFGEEIRNLNSSMQRCLDDLEKVLAYAP